MIIAQYELCGLVVVVGLGLIYAADFGIPWCPLLCVRSCAARICSWLCSAVKVINMSQCVPTRVNIGERVSISQFFVVGRNKVHCTALLPVSAR